MGPDPRVTPGNVLPVPYLTHLPSDNEDQWCSWTRGHVVLVSLSAMPTLQVEARDTLTLSTVFITWTCLGVFLGVSGGCYDHGHGRWVFVNETFYDATRSALLKRPECSHLQTRGIRSHLNVKPL